MIKNKKAVMHIPLEVVGGVIASFAIIWVLTIVLGTISASLVDTHNQKSQQLLVNSIAFVGNSELSGGEHTINNWVIGGGGNLVHTMVYIPQESARFMMEMIQQGSTMAEGSVGGDLEADISSAEKAASFVSKLGAQDLEELSKCNFPGEACYCMFKLEYAEGCEGKADIITMDVSKEYYETFDTSAVVKGDEVYDYESYRANQWVVRQLIAGLTNTAVKNAKILECIPLMSSGCVYTDVLDVAKSCIPHYSPFPNSRPIVWIGSQPNEVFSIETIQLNTGKYSSLDVNTYFEPQGSFPRIEKMYAISETEKEKEYFDTFYRVGYDFRYTVENGTIPCNTEKDSCGC